MIDINKVARLARLQLSKDEIQEFESQLAEVLGHVQQLEKIDIKNTVPLVCPTEELSIWREDKMQQSLSADEALESAPDRLGQLFKVPPVI